MNVAATEAAQYRRDGSELRWMASEYVTPFASASAVEPTMNTGSDDGIASATTTDSSMEMAPKNVSSAGGSRSRRRTPSAAASRKSARMVAW